MKRSPDPHSLDFYEGLVRKTASMYVAVVDDDYEDICQVLRIKVWRALGTFDPQRSTMPVERYVFSCVKNQCKDLVKKKKLNWSFIEDIAPTGGEAPRRDSFDLRYLSEDHEQAYSEVEDVLPLVPSTLTEGERRVVGLLYQGYSPTDVAKRLETTRPEVERTLANVRVKMADWAPVADRLPVAA